MSAFRLRADGVHIGVGQARADLVEHEVTR